MTVALGSLARSPASQSPSQDFEFEVFIDPTDQIIELSEADNHASFARGDVFAAFVDMDYSQEHIFMGFDFSR